MDTPIQYLIFFNENVQNTSWELERTYYGNQFIWVHSADLTALNGSFFHRHKQISYADLLGFENKSEKERDRPVQQHLKLEIEMVTKSVDMEISGDVTAASIAAIERLEIRPATSSAIFDHDRQSFPPGQGPGSRVQKGPVCGFTTPPWAHPVP